MIDPKGLITFGAMIVIALVVIALVLEGFILFFIRYCAKHGDIERSRMAEIQMMKQMRVDADMKKAQQPDDGKDAIE